MRRLRLGLFLLAPALALAAPPAELCLSDALGLRVADARLFEGTGPYRAPKISAVAEAQRFFEQGMVFGWGFNYPEAARSFRAATLRDPGCAMCRWGIAWAVGPNINTDMESAELPIARDALVQAQVYAADARERAMVAALAKRLPANGETIGDAEARRYSEAMIALADSRPEDADIAVLAAEALMTEHAYDWWRADGTRCWTARCDLHRSIPARTTIGSISMASRTHRRPPSIPPIGSRRSRRAWATSCTCRRTFMSGSVATTTRCVRMSPRWRRIDAMRR
jgi:hypothetical protein